MEVPRRSHRSGWSGPAPRSNDSAPAPTAPPLENGNRPAVFLATLGTPAQFTARATFAKNLFEAAGIRTIAGPPTEFAGSGTIVACLCSSDAVYGEHAEAAAADLRSAGAERIYVAGRKLGIEGVDEEVGVGSDILDVLTRTLDAMHVDSYGQVAS